MRCLEPARRRGRDRRPRGRPARDRRRGAAQPLRQRGRASTSTAGPTTRSPWRCPRSPLPARLRRPLRGLRRVAQRRRPGGAPTTPREPDPRGRSSASFSEFSASTQVATIPRRRWPSRRSDSPAPGATSAAPRTRRRAAAQRVPALPQPAPAAPRLPGLRHLRGARGDRARDRRGGPPAQTAEAEE